MLFYYWLVYWIFWGDGIFLLFIGVCGLIWSSYGGVNLLFSEGESVLWLRFRLNNGCGGDYLLLI